MAEEKVEEEAEDAREEDIKAASSALKATQRISSYSKASPTSFRVGEVATFTFTPKY